MAVQLCKYSKKHSIVYFKRVDFRVRELYFNKAVIFFKYLHIPSKAFFLWLSLDKRTQSSGVFMAVLFAMAMTLVGQPPNGMLAMMS